MGEVLRIEKRFQGTWRGNVYQVKKARDFSIWPEEIFWDLNGNRFQVKGVSTCREKAGEACLNIMFELLDRTGAVGDLLFRKADKSMVCQPTLS